MYDVPYHYQASYERSCLSSLFASIIKFPPENKPESYKDLSCTDVEEAIIYEIITTMAENNKLALLLKKNHMQNLGAQIAQVHPLKFLSTIVCHPHLNACLYEVFDDYFKRNGFMDGIGPSLSREAEKGRLERHIADFCVEVNTPIENLDIYFKKNDWEGLVRFLISR